MKRKLLFSIIFIVIANLTLLPLGHLNANAGGTSIELTKDATGSSEGYITWGIEKSVDRNYINLNVGETATVNYTVTVEPTYHETGRTVNGNININNTGNSVAIISYVKDIIEYRIGEGSWTELKTEDIISTSFTIPVGNYSVVPYSVSFIPVEGATHYRNTALVGLDNYSTSGVETFFNEFSYTTGFSISGGTITSDAFADVEDSLQGCLGQTWVGDTSTYIYNYSWTVGPYSTPGDYTVDNTATVTGKNSNITVASSMSVIIHVVLTKADKLINSNIPGKGLETAPGQQKPFNSKSQADINAGMKK